MSHPETLPFKHQDKASLTAMVPLEIRKLITKQAGKRGQSMSLITSEILCRGLGMDPAQFGIPVKTKSKPVAAV